MPVLDSLRSFYQRVSTEVSRRAQQLRPFAAAGAGGPGGAATGPVADTEEDNHLEKAPASSSGAGGGGRGVRFGAQDEVQEHYATQAYSDDEDEDVRPPPMNFMNRRQSVAAESFDPEKEDSENENEANENDHKSDEQKARLEAATKDILLFRCLDESQKELVIRAMKEVFVTAGQKVITQGEEGDNFYVIEKGKYDINVRSAATGVDTCVSNYVDQGSFGELALMYNTPRAATVMATTDGIIWSMDRSTFRRIVLKRAFLKRQAYEHLLKQVPLLKELSDYERANLADALQSKEYQDGETIIAQGDEGKQMYFIEEGQVRIVRRSVGSAGEEKQVNLLSKGAYFGELALITHKPRLASAYSSGVTKLAVLDTKAFERLMGPCIAIMRRNFDSYRAQLKEAFGSEEEITNIRGEA